MDSPVYASIIVDDVPLNATFWWRWQQYAFGYHPSEEGKWGRGWRDLESAPRFQLRDIHGFADYIEEFGIRGKFTMLPCPAGHGRIDREVRGYTSAELTELLGVVRDRIAPHMDITPEVLTHTMALDIETGGLLPHSESAWVSHLAAVGDIEALEKYIRHGYAILRNAGFAPHGLTVGGMTDPSGVAKGEMVAGGHHVEPLAAALLAVEKEFDPRVTESFVWMAAPPIHVQSKARLVPDVRYKKPGVGRVFAIHCFESGDVALSTLHGDANLDKEADLLISSDLEGGLLVKAAEAGRVLCMNLHTQTLNSLNTGQGLRLTRIITERLKQRYGKRLEWKTAAELCSELGVED